jgi:hypothetical protein
MPILIPTTITPMGTNPTITPMGTVLTTITLNTTMPPQGQRIPGPPWRAITNELGRCPSKSDEINWGVAGVV